MLQTEQSWQLWRSDYIPSQSVLKAEAEEQKHEALVEGGHRV